jgi:DNA-binding NtrC family response regulator
MPDRVLVVEDEETLRRNLARYLEQQGYQVTTAGTAEEAAGIVAESGPFDAAVVDVRLPGRDGLSLAAELSPQDTVIVAMTAYGTLDSAIDALHSGVHDLLVKPLVLKELGQRLARLLELRRVLHENTRLRRLLGQGEDGAGQAVARSAAMAKVMALAAQVAPSATTVLIEGESGAGKEVVARSIHEGSPRRDRPFLAVNVSALPETLAESQMFGHEKGSFTGADASSEGWFRGARGGTLFLDEMGDLALPLQVKLLRVLETKEVLPVGSTRPVKVDVRIIAATNADLQQAVQAKRFRSDLYYRLSSFRIRVPALRERPEDIPALARHFLCRHRKDHGVAVEGFDPHAMSALLTYPWPGNVRELSNAVERAVVVCRGKLISPEDLPPEVTGAAATRGGTYQEAMAEFERALLASELERTGGDRREAARALGVSLATLYRRIEKLGLRPGGPSPTQETTP